jgi:hypothetical protein
MTAPAVDTDSVVKTEQPTSPVVAVADQAKQSDAEEDTSADDEDTTATESASAKKKPEKDAVINIKRAKTRITLKATQASWVQVVDARQNIIYRKVLRPGEQYSVPDEPGLFLDTANAGGLDVIVDGKQVQPVGKAGEIVRGIVLDPDDLKIKKMMVRD